MSDIEFPGGMYVAKPVSSRPEYIKAVLSIKLENAIPFLEQQKAKGETSIQLEMRESKGGKFYAAIDRWKPTAKLGPALSVVPPSMGCGRRVNSLLTPLEFSRGIVGA